MVSLVHRHPLRRLVEVKDLTGTAGEAAQQLAERLPLTNLLQLKRVPLKGLADVVFEPAVPFLSASSQRQGEAASTQPVHVALAGSG
jgi:hypothetical protein